MKTSSLLCASALMLAACGSNEEAATPPAEIAATDTVAPRPAPTTGTPAAPTDAPGYIAKAGAGDMWEIESSQALLAKSKDEAVRKFAEMMIDQHEKSTAKIKAAAGAANIAVTAPTLDAVQRTMLDEIKQADAAGIDAVYLRHQRAAHAAALALHTGYGDSGDTESLKQAAREIVPVIQAHRAELDKLDARS
jgi:putative membrane protein